MNTSRLVLPLTLVALAVLAGCESMPAPNARLDAARSDYRTAQNEPRTRDLAAPELRRAGEAVSQANQAWSRNDATSEVDHLAYLAKTRVAIAQETGRRRADEQAIAGAEAARSQARLDARTVEADAAGRAAQASRLQAAASDRQTDDAQARTRQLQMQLDALNAKKTERGMVVTIGDLQFDTNRAQLKPDGVRNVEKLVSFLKQYPERKALVEGFTDSTGSTETNQTLSDERASAVRTALVQMGVGSERIATRGYGEAFPVAGNGSAAGRQSNRRVEVILSEDGGTVTPR